ncbi:MAG: nucleotidyltransferase family protein [Lachnospiraceae bacterium]|nr:nucleotidyltransferase family protein [Lachnospiraceae bacterium]
MTAAGIVAEYNPLHLGHWQQIKEVKERRGAELVFVAMSGSFVQRGEPALVDKNRRCAMALEAGADLVLEIPPAYATGGAEAFARGGVGVLTACGCVEELVFGASCPDTARLLGLARLTEAESLNPALDEGLRKGLSYPAALGEAVKSIDPEGAALLEDPNNLLGIEYIKAIEKQNSPLKAVALERKGDGHRALDLPREGYASGSAIRRALKEGERAADAQAFLAPGVAEKLSYTLWPEDISAALSAVLLEKSRTGAPALCGYADVSEDLAARILQQAPFALSFPELVERIGSRAYTAARIRRALLHILLDIKKEDQAGLPRSLKILGMRRDSRAGALLKEKARLPVITKTADAPPALSEAYAYAQRVYNQAVYFRHGIKLPEDYAQSPVVLL